MNTAVGGYPAKLATYNQAASPQVQSVLRQAKPKLIIPEVIETKIKYICSKISAVEWSGTLFYSVISGSIDSPGELVLKCEDIYLQDKGSSAHTQYKFGEDILDLYDHNPILEECKTAMLHL